ncbi:MAG TPA: ABC transporter permease, partial [Blastocatellia bacterium]
RQHPGFASVAIISLALGIGANISIFTLIDSVLLRSLPVKSPGQLVVFARDPDKPSVGCNYPDYEYIRDHNNSFSGVIASGGSGTAAFQVPDEGALSKSEVVSPRLVSGNYFEVLGVTPAIGRLLTPADNQTEDASPYVVLDYSFWKHRFGNDLKVVGREITLNGSPFTIVGVAGPGFTGTDVGYHPDVYLPIMMLPEIRRGVRQWNTRHYWWLTTMARLKPGVAREAAVPEADLLWKQILANDPEQKPPASYDKDYDQRNRGTLLPGSGGYSYFRNSIQKPLTVLMVVVALVLLIACSNVASILLARAASREKEIAIRLAVGAGRPRLMGQLLVEAVVISGIGGLLGLSLAWWGARLLLNFLPQQEVPLDIDLTPDMRLVAFALGVSLLAGVVCGIAPALRATRPDLTSSLKNEVPTVGRTRFDLRRGLVALQIAISLLLLIGAGLFIRSLRNLKSVDPGFVRDGVLLVDVNPEQSGYKGQRLREYYERLMAQTQSLHGVRNASLAEITPLAGSRWNSDVVVEGHQWQPDEEPYIDFNAVSAGYFETLGIPILLGRDFRPEDNPAVTPDPKPEPERPGDEEPKLDPPPPVAIINETMAKRFFPGQSPIGRHIYSGNKVDSGRAFEIVGVVKDSKYFGVREAVESMVYVPIWRFGSGQETLCVRSYGDPQKLIGAIREETAGLDPAVPILQTITLEDRFDSTISQERVVTTLCGFFGLLAVMLAAIGLYGVVAHSVTRRYREIGIRVALGAKSGSVLWLVLRDMALMLVIGAGVGLPAALALTRLVSSFLYGLTPQDPVSIVLATMGLAAVTVIAGYIPARRATRIDPMVALRYE